MIEHKLNLAEPIFSSIQGEGPNIGVPCIFIRLAGCNLNCEFCDTKFSWSKGKDMSIKDIITKIKTFKNINHIVITGGEPMLQIENILKLRGQLESDFINNTDAVLYNYELETNGSLWNDDITSCFQYISISPKKKTILHPDLIKERLNNNIIFKFVIENAKSFNFWNLFIKELNIYKRQVYMMPQSRTRQEFIGNGQDLATLCIKHGYRFAPRLQLVLWDKRQGV